MCPFGCLKTPKTPKEANDAEINVKESVEELRAVNKTQITPTRIEPRQRVQNPQHPIKLDDLNERQLMQRRKDLYYVLLTLQMQQNERRKKGVLTIPGRFIRAAVDKVEKFVENYERPEVVRNLNLREHPYYKKFIGFNDYDKYKGPVVSSPCNGREN